MTLLKYFVKAYMVLSISSLASVFKKAFFTLTRNVFKPLYTLSHRGYLLYKWKVSDPTLFIIHLWSKVNEFKAALDVGSFYFMKSFHMLITSKMF